MNEKITQGNWKVGELGHIFSERNDENVNIARDVFVEANAQLIAEAGTVTNECGLTPRQLLEDYERYKKSVEHIIEEKNSILKSLLEENAKLKKQNKKLFYKFYHSINKEKQAVKQVEGL